MNKNEKEKVLTTALAVMRRLAHGHVDASVMEGITKDLGNSPRMISKCLDIVALDGAYNVFVAKAVTIFDWAYQDNVIVLPDPVPQARVILFDWDEDVLTGSQFCDVQSSLSYEKLQELIGAYGTLSHLNNVNEFQLKVSGLYDLGLARAYCKGLSNLLNGEDPEQEMPLSLNLNEEGNWVQSSFDFDIIKVVNNDNDERTHKGDQRPIS